SGADYTSLSDAVSAAIPGDTLHIHPSGTSYGGLTTTKRLIIVGLSHNPANAKVNEKAIVGNVTFQGNSANSLITGMQFTNISSSNVTDCNNIRVVNNRGSNISGNNNVDDWVIEGNILFGVVNNNNSDGWMVKNNIFQRTNYPIQGFNNTTSFLNNIVINSSDNFAHSSVDPIVNNNIFILTGSADEVGLINGSTIVFNNCLTYSPNFNPITALSGSNNLDETNPNFANIEGGDYTDYYNNDYNVSGAAVNAGTDGTDLGVHGAMFNFDVHGRPDDFPYMTTLDISNSSVPMGQNIDVTFTAEKKN
ncbi:MAG TPA: hypothetical protein VKN14_12910, partial [Flavobacteriaceae bacterium]|nr:hypothetical protein [Flavobacteriaceae bacterium]